MIFCFFFYKIGQQEGEQGLQREDERGFGGRGGGGERRVKVVQMMCPHVSKCKNDTC
jgi:hypothetical protein